jgi:PAS domain S-box-containing protein
MNTTAQDASAPEDREGPSQHEQLLRTIADAVPVLICYVDSSQRYRFNNAAYERWFGYSRDQITGKHLREVVGEQAYEVLRPTVERALAGEQFSVEASVHYRAAGLRDIAVTYVPHRVENAVVGYTALIEDITERKRAQAALRQSEERYRAFVANSSEGIWRYELDESLDLSLPPETQLDHMYRYARLAELNDVMARMYGYEQADALLGARLDSMLPPSDPSAREYLLGVVKVGYAFTNVESAGRDRDGNLRYFENSMVPVIKDGKLLRAWGVQRDITERKLAEAALREGDKRKDTFLATLAHELRNPLAPIRNGLQILRKRADANDEIVQQTVTMMHRQMTHMVRLVDDLLDVSRITRGKLELKRERAAVSELARSAIEVSRSLIEARGQIFSLDMQADDLFVSVDPDRIVQVLANLLSNAAKFTQRGGAIGMKVYRDGAHAVIQVQDSGIGIAADDLEHIFEPFAQLHAHDAPGEGGLGIGLSIVRELVQMHGGVVSAHSEGAGRGTLLTVRLPLDVSGSESNRGAIPSTETTGRKQIVSRRILIVDDNSDAARTLAMLMEIDGHHVRTASNGAEAIAETRSFAPDIIFMDVGMPLMDGMEATRHIRALPRGNEIFIVALTGWGQDSDRQHTRSAGMDHHLVKPVSALALRHAFEEFEERELRPED